MVIKMDREMYFMILEQMLKGNPHHHTMMLIERKDIEQV
jgi:hypothetical protein